MFAYGSLLSGGRLGCTNIPRRHPGLTLCFPLREAGLSFEAAAPRGVPAPRVGGLRVPGTFTRPAGSYRRCPVAVRGALPRWPRGPPSRVPVHAGPARVRVRCAKTSARRSAPSAAPTARAGARRPLCPPFPTCPPLILLFHLKEGRKGEFFIFNLLFCRLSSPFFVPTVSWLLEGFATPNQTRHTERELLTAEQQVHLPLPAPAATVVKSSILFLQL